jgi:hypothetical protein
MSACTEGLDDQPSTLAELLNFQGEIKEETVNKVLLEKLMLRSAFLERLQLA